MLKKPALVFHIVDGHQHLRHAGAMFRGDLLIGVHPQPDESPEDLRNSVTSKAGTTAAGLAAYDRACALH